MSDLIGLSKLNTKDGVIYHFLYQQDGRKLPMNCKDTLDNRITVSWIQVHDAPPQSTA